MKRTLYMGIECGETTCASEPGKFCKYTGATSFGTVPVCLLFRNVDGDLIRLRTGEDGWLRRCPGCIAAERFLGRCEECRYWEPLDVGEGGVCTEGDEARTTDGDDYCSVFEAEG